MMPDPTIAAIVHYESHRGLGGRQKTATFDGLPVPDDRKARSALRSKMQEVAVAVLDLATVPRVRFSDEDEDPAIRWVDLYEVQNVSVWRKYLHRVPVPVDTLDVDLLDEAREAIASSDRAEMEECGDYGDDDYGDSGWSLVDFETAAKRLEKGE